MVTDSPSSPSKTGPSKNEAPSKPHDYTSLHDLLEFPCKCPICTYVRQRRERGRRPEPSPQLADTLVTRLALAMLLPIPDPPRFQSSWLTLWRSLWGLRAPADATLEFLDRHVVDD